MNDDPTIPAGPAATATTEPPAIGTHPDYQTVTQRWVDEVCYYRNLAITHGARPTEMLNDPDRALCEAGITDAAMDEQSERSEIVELWDEVDALRAALAAPSPATGGCTGLTALWCPIHGGCSCPVTLGANEGPAERHLDDRGCALHALESPHAAPSPAPPEGPPPEFYNAYDFEAFMADPLSATWDHATDEVIVAWWCPPGDSTGVGISVTTEAGTHSVGFLPDEARVVAAHLNRAADLAAKGDPFAGEPDSTTTPAPTGTPGEPT